MAVQTVTKVTKGPVCPSANVCKFHVTTKSQSLEKSVTNPKDFKSDKEMDSTFDLVITPEGAAGAYTVMASNYEDKNTPSESTEDLSLIHI